MPDAASQTLIDSLDIGIIILNSDLRVDTWNSWIQNASGVPVSAAVGKTLDELFPKASLKRVISGARIAIESGISSIVTHSLNPKLFPLKTRSGKLLDHNVLIGAIGQHFPFSQCCIQIIDVTDAHERETILRQRQNARYDAVVNSASDVIITLDASGIIQFANPATAKQLGYSPSELIGKSASILFKTPPRWNAIWNAVIGGESPSQSTEVAAVRKDGAVTYLEVSASRWKSDNHILVSAILRDVNARRQIEALLKEVNTTLEIRVAERTAQLQTVEEALRQSQKMEAIGQLTGGIAHDFNNLLQGIMGSLNLIQRYISNGRVGNIDKFIQGALTSADRAAALVHRLLAFSRRQPVSPKPIDVHQLVSSIEDMLRRAIGEMLTLKIVAEKNLWLVRCDGNQLENAFLNLAINARDAMPDGGVLDIAVQNIVLDSIAAQSHDVPAGEYVLISVTDAGTGMTPEIKARAFDPFYTTKPIGQGTGLGLSMIYGYARQSGGGIWIDSELNRGTSVHLCLPRFKGELEVENTVKSVAESRIESNKVILVVEDEAVVRLLVAEAVKDLGYLVLEADNGTAALHILNTTEQVDLLLTDIGLPGMGGRQLVDMARIKRPTLKILFMTGYAENASGSDFLETGMEIIPKPFDMELLAKRMRTMLES